LASQLNNMPPANVTGGGFISATSDVCTATLTSGFGCLHGASY